ncbi:MAG: sugar ABC transporter permease [Lachnospiraceae bacterium]|nr:sugar ABC transporter permease [Lachnospiraceae bacterium]
MSRVTKKRDASPYLFMLPVLIIYLSVIIFPIGYSLWISFRSGTGIGEMEFVGFANYAQLLHDPTFWLSLRHTIVWIVLTVAITMTVSLALAVLLNKQFRGRVFFRGLFYFPSVIAIVAVGIIWRWIYNPQIGFINQFFSLIGIDYTQTWLSQSNTVIIALFVAALWQAIGQPMILFLAGLQSVSPDVLEASSIDGANAVQKFFRITIPLMRDTFVMVICTLIISAMKVYDIVKALTDGGPNNASQMLATYMYSQTFTYNNVGYGTAIAVVMVIIMLIVVIPYMTFTARADSR